MIEQAKGILGERMRLPIDDAFLVLRRAARTHRLKVQAVARRVVDEPETPAIVVAALHAHLSRK